MGTSNSHSIIIICLFAVLFMLIGVYSPVVYATYMPQEQIISVNEFHAQSATTSDDSHYVCWNRTMHNDRVVSLRSELLLLSADGQAIEVDQQYSEQVFEAGQRSVLVEMPLPPDLVTGEYQYRFVISVQMADGRVDRNLFIDSQRFTVSDNQPESPISC